MGFAQRILKCPRKSWMWNFVVVLHFIALTLAEIPTEKQVKSLFDDLPLNGALPASLELNSKENLHKGFRKGIQLNPESSPKESSSNIDDELKSLFDQLPDQGAMGNIESTNKSQVKNLNPNARAQRHSLSGRLSPPNRFGNDGFEIEHKPTTDLNLSFFNSNLLPPILRSLTQNEERTSNAQYGAPIQHSTIPIIGNGNSQNSNTGYESNFPPAAEPATLSGAGASSFSGEHYTNAVRIPENEYKAPSSGGSTVIVFANGQPNTDQLPVQPGEYGPPKDAVKKEKTQNSNSEIHYHYHLNNGQNKPSENIPNVSYGQPRPPPRSSYEPLNLRKPPGNVYLPPPSSGGYSQTPQNPPPDFSSAPLSSEEIPDLFPPPSIPQDAPTGYGSNPSGRPRPPSGNSRPSHGHPRPRPPSHGHSRPRPPSVGHSRPRPQLYGQIKLSSNEEQQSQSTSSDQQIRGYDSSTYTTLEDEQEETEDQRALHREDFQSRTLLTNNQYGVPSNSYGPPPPAYGSPDASPPAPNDQGNPVRGPTRLTQTSITLETIPITTTETRLVTVPKITQTLGSSHNQFDAPAPPPNSPSVSSGYGSGFQSSSYNVEPPAPPSEGTKNTRTILNEQLLQLSPPPSKLSDLSEIDLLSILQSQDNPTVDILTPQRGSIFGSGSRATRLPELSTSAFLNSHNLRVGNLRDLNLGTRQISGLGGLRGQTPVLSGDAEAVLSDLIREQRLQSSSDLRQRLRHQSFRDADKTRQTYRNLFYKGALLLGGLSLIPSVASVGGGRSSLLPLTGRSKRSLGNFDDGLRIRTCLELPPFVIPMPQKGNHSLSILTVRRRNCKDPSKKVSFSGALVPNEIHTELDRYYPMEEILQNSQCIQRYFCENLLEVHAQKKPDSALFLLSALSSNLETNPWLQEAMTAAKNRQCSAFYCHATTPAIITSS